MFVAWWNVQDLELMSASDGRYCTAWFQTGFKSSNNPECDEFYIRTAYVQAKLSVRGDIDQLKAKYTSITSICA